MTTEPTKAIVQDRRLIIMTRVPEAGRVKTRLIPGLGTGGALALHEALLRRTLLIVDIHAQQSDVDLEVRFTGGSEFPVKDFPTDQNLFYRPQQGADLGERMNAAISTALDDGANAAIVIGTDCPDLSPEVLDRAWKLLERRDVVLGPAVDGGYYLIGLKAAASQLFEGIDWGTREVLRQTLDRCRELRKSVGLLPVLSDVDEAEDLVICRRLGEKLTACLPHVEAGLLSIIIPTLNEAAQIESTLQPIQGCPDCEVIVVDGGSTDETVELARQLGCRVVQANRGRGRQLNAGAALARGELLLFLHADTKLPVNFRREVQRVLDFGGIAGAFRFQIDHPGWMLRCVEWGTNLRARFLQRPYGDQGLFLRAQDFFRLGGFPNWPLMEDVELCGKLRAEGRIRIASASIQTSARRMLKLGVIRSTLVNQLCLMGFSLGVSADRLARWYGSRSGQKRKSLD